MFWYGVLVLFLILSCFSRGDPGGQANFENHGRSLCFSMDLLGCSFCAQCKENQFQSTGARRTERETSQETAPARGANMHPKSAIFGSKNGSRITPKSFPEAQTGTKRHREPPKRGQKRPRASQEHPKNVQERFSHDLKALGDLRKRWSAPWAAAVRAYPGGLRPGKRGLNARFQNTLSPQAVVGGLTMAPPTPPTTLY